jgi:hypothetical protein
VIANESFGDYVAGLQREYREDGIGIADAPPVPTPARRSEAIRRMNISQVKNLEDFLGKVIS